MCDFESIVDGLGGRQYGNNRSGIGVKKSDIDIMPGFIRPC